jgi:hypothetical protein
MPITTRSRASFSAAPVIAAPAPRRAAPAKAAAAKTNENIAPEGEAIDVVKPIARRKSLLKSPEKVLESIEKPVEVVSSTPKRKLGPRTPSAAAVEQSPEFEEKPKPAVSRRKSLPAATVSVLPKVKKLGTISEEVLIKRPAPARRSLAPRSPSVGLAAPSLMLRTPPPSKAVPAPAAAPAATPVAAPAVAVKEPAFAPEAAPAPSVKSVASLVVDEDSASVAAALALKQNSSRRKSLPRTPKVSEAPVAAEVANVFDKSTMTFKEVAVEQAVVASPAPSTPSGAALTPTEAVAEAQKLEKLQAKRNNDCKISLFVSVLVVAMILVLLDTVYPALHTEFQRMYRLTESIVITQSQRLFAEVQYVWKKVCAPCHGGCWTTAIIDFASLHMSIAQQQLQRICQEWSHTVSKYQHWIGK